MSRFPRPFLILSILALVACGDPSGEDAAVVDASDAIPEAQTEAEAGDVLGEPELDLLPRARVAEEGVLSGGQPKLEHLDRLAAAGYRTVVNLRGRDEEGQLPAEAYEERALRYLELPIASADDLSEENARRLAELVHDPANRPLALHCGSGNRVGALLALEAFHVHEVPAEEALQAGLDGGMTRLEPVVRERLGLPPAEPEG